MGGSNPYIEQIEVKTATESFAVTFHMPDATLEVQVDPAKIPYGPTGQPGSLLDIAMGRGNRHRTCLRRSLRLFDLSRRCEGRVGYVQ